MEFIFRIYGVYIYILQFSFGKLSEALKRFSEHYTKLWNILLGLGSLPNHTSKKSTLPNQLTSHRVSVVGTTVTYSSTGVWAKGRIWQILYMNSEYYIWHMFESLAQYFIILRGHRRPTYTCRNLFRWLTLLETQNLLKYLVWVDLVQRTLWSQKDKPSFNAKIT
jgi:hypothetical protein